MEDLSQAVEALYDVRDHFFGSAKAGKLREFLTKAEQVFAELPKEAQQSAQACFLLGKALDAQDSFDPRAEQLLSKSLKLDRMNPEAWCALGHCYWKNGQTQQAADCFRNGSEIGGSATLGCLQHHGQLLRSLGSSPKETLDNTRESVKICKQALKLDFKNAQSWYLLGNALLASYYVDQRQPGRNDLPAKILAAFANAERNGQANRNPDLYFNRAKFYKYMQNFPAAVRDFATAAQIDSQLQEARDEIGAIKRRFSSIRKLIVAKRGGIKPKHFKSALQKLSQEKAAFQLGVRKAAAAAAAATTTTTNPATQNDFFTRPSTSPALLADLAQGDNGGKYVHVKMLATVSGTNDPPATWLVVDTAGTIFALAIYDAAETPFGRVTSKSHIIVIEPRLVHVKLPKDVAALASADDAHDASSKTAAQPTPENAADVSSTDTLEHYPAIHICDGRKVIVDGQLAFDYRQVQMQSVSQLKTS